MTESDGLFHPHGDPIDGFQVNRANSKFFITYFVMPAGEDPNAEAETDIEKPAPLEVTVFYPVEPQMTTSIQAQWYSNAPLSEFANSVETYFQRVDSDALHPSDVVSLSVYSPTDEYPDSTIQEEHQRPLDSDALNEIFTRASVDQTEVSSVSISHVAGDFYSMDAAIAVEFVPSGFSDVQSALGGLVDVYDMTRDIKTAPSSNAFRTTVIYALADALIPPKTATPEVVL